MKNAEWKKAGLVLALMGAATLVQAEQGEGRGDREGGKQGRRPPKHMLEQYDVDGDGKLSETEKAALKEGMKAQRQEMMEKYDTDGDGQLNDEERAALREEMGGKRGGPEGEEGQRKGQRKKRMSPEQRQEMLEKYDADGDGKLSETEKEALKEDMKAKRQEMIAKYDADGDGELNEEERAALREEMGGKRGGPKGEEGQRKGKDKKEECTTCNT